MHNQLLEILDAYTRLSGREAKLGVYEHSLFDWVRAGFTKEDMITVINYINRENRRNDFKYSLRLGHLINDHQRFEDLLQEAKAKDRNRVKPPTERQKVLSEFRGTPAETEGTGTVRQWGDILKTIKTP